MTAYDIEITIEAEQEISEAVQWYAAQDTHAAEVFKTIVFESIDIIRDCPLGGASRLRSAWRSICGHFDPCLVPDSGAIGSSPVTKLTRNSPRHTPAS